MHIHGYQARHSLPSILHTPLSVLCSALNENRKCIKQKAESLTCFMIIQNHIYESVFDAELYLAARCS